MVGDGYIFFIEVIIAFGIIAIFILSDFVESVKVPVFILLLIPIMSIVVYNIGYSSTINSPEYKLLNDENSIICQIETETATVSKIEPINRGYVFYVDNGKGGTWELETSFNEYNQAQLLKMDNKPVKISRSRQNCAFNNYVNVQNLVKSEPKKAQEALKNRKGQSWTEWEVQAVN